MISAFGVQHGRVSKAADSKKKQAATTAAVTTGTAGAAYLGAVNSKKGSEFLDRRALKVAEELMPSGTRLKGKRGKVAITENLLTDNKNKGPVSGRVKNRLGYREVTTNLQSTRGRNIGEFRSEMAPTKHVKITYGKITRKSDRGLGHGSQLINTAVSNAQNAKIPSFKFMASHYGIGSGKKPTGDQVWRKPGVKFSGIGYHPAAYANVHRFSDGEARKAGYRHLARAAAKLDTPADAAKLPAEAQNALRGSAWFGRVKGARPFLGKTKYAAVGAATGVVAFREKSAV